jgi:signal transduction histidine kinase
LPAPIEAAAYFVVAEALTNTARYAHASKSKVQVERENGSVRVLVADDGVGGADATKGSGLRGLEDRLAALDGTLVVDSAEGGGTTVTAVIPCE